MKPPKYINLEVWFREHCTYDVWRNRRGRKYHFFWLPHRAAARIWPFHSNLADYPERELTQVQLIEEGWTK